ncbi:hypothetical protein D3C81_2002810 [compost metagenome]
MAKAQAYLVRAVRIIHFNPVIIHLQNVITALCADINGLFLFCKLHCLIQLAIHRYISYKIILRSRLVSIVR